MISRQSGFTYQMASDAFNRSDLALRELALDPHSSMALTTQLIVLWQTLFYSTAFDRDATLEQAVEHLRLARGMQTGPECIERRLQFMLSAALGVERALLGASMLELLDRLAERR